MIVYSFPIGYICHMTTEGLDFAVKLALDGVQLWADPSLDAAEQKQFIAEVAARGLQVSALCGDIGDYCDAAKNIERVPAFFERLEQAAAFGTKVVTTHIGCVPEDKNDPVYAVMQDACGRIGERAAALGLRFAVETGPEKATVLKDFLDSLHSKGAGVNLDPANLTMCACDDAVAAVEILKDYIVHTHAKDGINLRPRTAEHDWEYIEMPLGEGHVDFPAYLRALDRIGYRGFLTIEREVKDPEADIRMAAGFLRKLIADA